MLETHDPKWAEKWDRAHAMMRELEVRDWSSLTTDERNQLDKLRRLLPVAYDAGHRTATTISGFSSRSRSRKPTSLVSGLGCRSCPIMPASTRQGLL